MSEATRHVRFDQYRTDQVTAAQTVQGMCDLHWVCAAGTPGRA